MAIYNKTKTGGYNLVQLQQEINSDSLIVPSCLEITGTDNNLLLNFASALGTTGSPSEEAQLDSLIANHEPDEEEIGVTQLPFSRHLSGKLAVHSSAKPEPEDTSTYAVWAGSGDDPTLDVESSLGAGDLLAFNMTFGNAVEIKDIKFDARHGRVWIHEAYVKFENGGIEDYLTADIVAPPTPLQQAIDLNYYIEDGWLKYATGGAGSPPTGTHGLAGSPVLVPRPFSKDGDWDYDGANLTPNLTQTGGYKITTIERPVHRYFNKIPLHGSSTTYFTMSSEETAELAVNLGYFIRVNVFNVSNSNWSISMIMELYRERTMNP